MASLRKKFDLPAKTCPVCLRTFVWQKKWARVWNEVRHCSDACRTYRSSRQLATHYHASRVHA